MSSIFFGAIKKILSSQLSEITVSSDRCIDESCKAKKLCSICQDNCVVDAINIDDGVEIDWDKCIKCGVCAAVCPTEVFKIQAPSDNKILSSIIGSSKEENIIIECNFVNESFQGKEKRPKNSGRKIVVPCIGRFSETFLLLSILSGGDKVEFVGCTSDCRFSIGKETIEKMWWRTENLFKIFERTENEDKLIMDNNQDQSGRRKLFRETGFQAMSMLLSQSSQTSGSSNSNIKTPPHRAELLQLIERYSSPTILVERKNMPFSNIKLTPEKCRVSGICASVCPTEALQFSESNQGKELSFKLGLCVGCEACVYICPEDALEIDKEVDLSLLSSQRQKIMELKYQLCTSCGRQFYVKTNSDSLICKSCIRKESFLEEYAKDS